MRNLIFVLSVLFCWLVVPQNLKADVSVFVTTIKADDNSFNVEKENRVSLKEKIVLKAAQSQINKSIRKAEKNGMKTHDTAVIGFVAGLLSVIAFLALLGSVAVGALIAWLALSVIAIVMSGTALKRIKNASVVDKHSGKGWAIAGLVLAIAPLVLSVVAIVVYLGSY